MGLGSVYFDETKGLWRAQVSFGTDPATGRRLRKSVSDADRKAVERELTALLDQRAANQKPASKLTMAEFLTRFMDEHVSGLAPNTQRSYARHIEKTLKPMVGKIRLGAFEPKHVYRLDGKLTGAGKGGRTRVLCRAILQSAFRWGSRIAHICPTNPVLATIAPQHKAKRRKPWSREEAKTFLAWARENDAYVWAFVSLAVGAGMRFGELLGLQWEHVDLDRGVVRVVGQLLEVQSEIVGLSELKTENSFRDISLPDFAVTALRTHRMELLKQGLTASRMVFPGRRQEATYTGQGTVRRAFARACLRSGVRRITVHDLRHTSFTWLMEEGEQLQAIKERAGHSQIAMTGNVYGHITAGRDKGSAAKLDKAMSP